MWHFYATSRKMWVRPTCVIISWFCTSLGVSWAIYSANSVWPRWRARASIYTLACVCTLAEFVFDFWLYLWLWECHCSSPLLVDAWRSSKKDGDVSCARSLRTPLTVCADQRHNIRSHYSHIVSVQSNSSATFDLQIWLPSLFQCKTGFFRPSQPDRQIHQVSAKKNGFYNNTFHIPFESSLAY